MFYKSNVEWAKDSLEKAFISIKDGFEEMKSITKKDNAKMYNTSALEKELRSMLKVVDISGVNVNFFVRGQKRLLEEDVYDTLKRVLTELVTNTLKHSKATELLLAINITENEIRVQTMDNGIGVRNLVKGNGLNGIDGRLSLVNGKVKYRSEMNEGFSTNMNIPI